MDHTAAQVAIKLCLREIGCRLDEAAGIARAADACAESGQVDKTVEVSHDIEQLPYEASRLLDAASLLNRLSENSCVNVWSVTDESDRFIQNPI